MNRLSAVACLTWCLTAVAWADTTVKIPMRTLEQRGVFARNFAVYHLLGDGRTILGADEPPFTVKSKGTPQRLWLFGLTPEFKLDKAKVYNLPIPKIEQANFTPDLGHVVISSKRGTDIHKLELEKGALSVLQTHTPGQPGFRIHSDVFSLYGGKLYTVGYFYDEEDYSGPEQMVEIDPARTGREAFTKVADIDAVRKPLAPTLRIASMLSPEGCLFYTEEPGGWTVHRWTPAGGVQAIDQGQKVLGTWGEGPLGVYCILKPGGTCEVVLVNAQTGQKTVVHSGPEKFLNPCLGKDGNTLVVAQEVGPNQVDYWVAQDVNGWKMRKVLEKLPPGTLRVSHDGSLVSHYHGLQGLTLVKLSP
jgi:hypothetical protein